VLWWRRSR